MSPSQNKESPNTLITFKLSSSTSKGDVYKPLCSGFVANFFRTFLFLSNHGLIEYFQTILFPESAH